MANGTLPPWTPFARATLPPLTPGLVAAMARQLGETEEAVRRQAAAEASEVEVWLNGRYQVNARRAGPWVVPGTRLVHLSIKRRDKAPLGEEHFRDLQRIKNELLGPEVEGVELYPAESRLVDTSNQYHVFCVVGIPEGGDGRPFRWPLGFAERLVYDELPPGPAVQRRRDED